jgi:23S rRNA pseudouridine2605 synthase
MNERLQKLISAAGLCSRRRAEEWIQQGKVTVNGVLARLGDTADPALDEILADGKPLPAAPRQTTTVLLYKPRGYVTTLSDEMGRPTAAELVADCGVRVFPVGRLDLDSEGLLLFTNDGALMQSLIHPGSEVDKLYHVTVTGAADDSVQRLESIRQLDGETIRPAKVRQISRQGGQALLEITIHEGKKRQIRRMCRDAGLQVIELRRIKEHTLSLGGLEPGKWRYLTEHEIKELKGSDTHEE